MRTFLMVMMIAGLMSTVGVYAAGLGGAPTVTKVGGTGASTVSAPTDSAVSVDWTVSGSDVTAAVITWTPNESKTYDIEVIAGGTTGTLTTGSKTGGSPTTDTVTMANTAVEDISTAEVLIKAN